MVMMAKPLSDVALGGTGPRMLRGIRIAAISDDPPNAPEHQARLA
jgi:hypothetical protein